MKEIKCIENNGYNITVGNVYLLLQESQDFYFVVNDNNKTVKYSKQMFELVEEEAPQVIEPVKRTEQDMIDSIVWNNNSVRFNDLDNNVVNVNNAFSDYGTEASCGIKAIDGLDATLQYINAAVPEDDDYLELRKAIFKIILKNRIIYKYAGDNCAMRILSTTANQDSDMLSVLDEMANMVSEVKNNPNSGNDIKMWVFYTE